MAIADITPHDMVADLDKKIEWFEKNPPRDRETGALLINPAFYAQLDMLRAMRGFIASKIEPTPGVWTDPTPQA